jgi:hypothetical protein
MKYEIKMKEDLKKALQRWDTHCTTVSNDTVVDATETQAQQLARISRLRKDYSQFVSYYFPHWCTDKTTGRITASARFHVEAANTIKNNRTLVAVFQWARGHAKSTHMDVFIPMWLMTQEERTINVMVLVGKSQENACTLLSDIQAELQFNQRYINDYGTQYDFGHWLNGEFVTQSGVAFFARGRGQSPRGLRYRDARPDYIVIDDLDDDELCLNEDRVKKMTRWVQEALFGCFGAAGGRFIMVGNLISKTSVLANIAAIEGAYLTRVNVRDKNGQPSWPALWTEERIRQKETFMSYASFQKEYMNNPITEGAVFNELHFEKIPPLKRFPLLACYGDPSPSNNTNRSNSMKAVWLAGFLDGRFYIIDGRVDRVTNAQFVDWFYDINAGVPQGVQVYNLIENNTLQDPFYQQVFIPMFMERAKAGKSINIAPDERKKPDKFSRIEGNLEPLNRQQRLILNADKKDDPHFRRLEEQFLLLTPRLSAPADGADCIEGAVWWLQRKHAALIDGAISLHRRPNNKFKI